MTCGCGNAARYVTEQGQMTCALCPMLAKVNAVRITDLPAVFAMSRTLLFWVREHCKGNACNKELEGYAVALAGILGRDLSNDPV